MKRKPLFLSLAFGIVWLITFAWWRDFFVEGQTFMGTPATVWPQLAITKTIPDLTRATAITHAGDGSGRLFVAELGGRVRIIQNDVLLTTPFLDISNRIRLMQGSGLLNIAFPPNFASKRYLYVIYSGINRETVLSRFRISNTDPNQADPNSEEIIIAVPHPRPTELGNNHYGSGMAFGPDGYLYISIGDGGCAPEGIDCQWLAQSLDSLRGKILRLDVESGTTPYAVPADNPFVGVANARPEIWAFGLRNPWRLSFDSATGAMVIADVGQYRFDEIHVEPAGSGGGANYGWPIVEGMSCFLPATNCNTAGLTMPVHIYAHEAGRCAVIGGMDYRGTQHPFMAGIYYFGDHCSGEIWGLRPAQNGWDVHMLLDTTYRLVTFGSDETGDLWLSDFVGTIHRLGIRATPTPTRTPTTPVCGPLVQEAETGLLHGVVRVGSDTAASGRAYIHVPSDYRTNRTVDERHKAVFCLTVPETATYRLRARVHAPKGNQNSFFVRMDNGTPMVWHLPIGNAYRLVEMKTTFRLTAGNHLLTFYWREPGARLDTFELYR